MALRRPVRGVHERSRFHEEFEIYERRAAARLNALGSAMTPLALDASVAGAASRNVRAVHKFT